MACISHHINGFIWDVITYPWFPNFNDGGLTKPSLKLGHGLVIPFTFYVDSITYIYPDYLYGLANFSMV